MTVATETYRDSYVASGALTARGIPFPFLEPEHVALSVDGAEKVLGTHFTITGSGRTQSAVMTPLEAWNGDVVLERETPDGQQYDTKAFVDLRAESLEYELDRRAMIESERQGFVVDLDSRAFRVLPGQSAPPIDKTIFAGMFYAGDGAGNLVPAQGTGNDAALRADLASIIAGAALVNFTQLYGVSRTLLDKARERVTMADFGVSAVTSANFNRLAGQVALDHGFAKLELPNYTIPLDAALQFKFSGQRITGAGPKSKLVKSDPEINRLIYADALSDVGIEDIAIDGMRDQTAHFVDECWCVFFRSCMRPFVRNCHVVGALTDNIVFELCFDPEATNTVSNDSNKGGFYWSSCDGGRCIACVADGNGATDDDIGSGFLISCTWGLSLHAIRAKNNEGGQIVMSRGNKGISICDAVLGGLDQTRGMYGLYAIGERTSGTVHDRGFAYDGVVNGDGDFISGTFYGTESSSFTNVTGYLMSSLDYVYDIDLINHVVYNDNDDAARPHGISLLKSNKIRVHGGNLVVTHASGVGIALSNNGKVGETTPYPTAVTVTGTNFVVTSGTYIYKYEALATYTSRGLLIDGVPMGNAAIASLSVSATSGSLPSPTGAMLFANAAAPTSAELLKFGIETLSKLESVLIRLRLAGIILP